MLKSCRFQRETLLRCDQPSEGVSVMSLTSDSEDQPTYSTDSTTSEESASSSSGDSSSNDDE